MSHVQTIAKLAEQLRLPAESLNAYQQLSEEDLAKLNQALGRARSQQSQALQEAISKALDHVPRLLRKPILKILGEGRS